MISATREELVLLRECTASLDLKIDCDKALRGDEEAERRCEKILRRARPTGVAS